MAAGGTDDGLWSAVPLVAELACICPLVAANLFVKLDIAQPAHEVSFAGVPIRGEAPPAAATPGDGIAVSGIVAANLRIRAIYTSTLF